MAAYRIVLTGSESTGKSELARALAAHYGTSWSAEYVRDYLDAKGEALTIDDVEAIARGQMAREDAAVAAANGVAILDTDLLSTCIYSNHYYSACPVWAERAARERLGDLYLLLDIDVPWAPDAQRDRGEQREEMHGLFVEGLRAFGARVVVIRGDWDTRRERAIEAIEAFLASRE